MHNYYDNYVYYQIVFIHLTDSSLGYIWVKVEVLLFVKTADIFKSTQQVIGVRPNGDVYDFFLEINDN